jgi:hypothetical protein
MSFLPTKIFLGWEPVWEGMIANFLKNGRSTFTYSDRHCGSKVANTTANKNV